MRSARLAPPRASRDNGRARHSCAGTFSRAGTGEGSASVPSSQSSGRFHTVAILKHGHWDQQVRSVSGCGRGGRVAAQPTTPAWSPPSQGPGNGSSRPEATQGHPPPETLRAAQQPRNTGGKDPRPGANSRLLERRAGMDSRAAFTRTASIRSAPFTEQMLSTCCGRRSRGTHSALEGGHFRQAPSLQCCLHQHALLTHPWAT